MKKLSKILGRQEAADGFPMLGMNGYAGEQDGTEVLLGIFDCANRKEAEGIIIPEKAKLHWARYSPGHGWTGVIGIWSDQTDERFQAIGIVWI